MKRSFSLSTKFNFGLGLVLAIFGLSSIVILSVFGKTKALNAKTNEVYLPAIVRTGELEANLSSYRATLLEMIHASNSKAREEAKARLDESVGNLTIYL